MPKKAPATHPKEKYALLSVFDKTGIIDLATALESSGFKIISTGGTAKTLTEKGIEVIPINEITGNPECFEGRMKTISFQIESGILFDRNKPNHVKEAKDLNVKPIDIVVCNLYPFEETISKPKTTLNDAIESIDVGGPTMIRAAAKNFNNVLVVVDPKDYPEIINKLEKSNTTEKFKKRLAAKAFAHLSFYDSQIADYLKEDFLSDEITIPGRKTIELKYGENPHQKAAFYTYPYSKSPMTKLTPLTDKVPSLINIVDINAAIKAIELFKKEAAAVIIKHHTPCGIALGKTAPEALKRALEADPESAFGGIIALNKTLDLKTARIIANFKKDRGGNIDIIAASNVDKKAVELLRSVRKNMGIYSFGKTSPDSSSIKFVDGGFVLQTADNNIEKNFEKWKIVTKKKPSKKQLEQMKVAWKFISRIKSNTIAIIDEKLPMTRGIGSGQTSRFRSTKIALEQAGKNVKNGILASDSFFPFDDSVKLAAKYKIGAIVQQGGSINDKLSIEAADKAGLPMVLTYTRAFWH